MVKIMNCNKCKKKTKCLTWRYEDVEGCKHFKPTTQFDHMKSINNTDEMAKFLIAFLSKCNTRIRCKNYDDCVKCIKTYLESEVTE